MPKRKGWSTKPQGRYVRLRIDEINRYMRNRDWTNADLARAMADDEGNAFHRSTVHRLLNGTMDCDERKAELIAAAFGVTIEAIADYPLEDVA